MATTASTAAATDSTKLKSIVENAILAEMARRETPVSPAAPAPEPAAPEPELVVGPGQEKFSKLAGKRLPKALRDFAVTIIDGATIPSEVKAFIPAVNKAYNIQLDQAHAILMAWEMGEKVLITGPTGSGKSSLIEQCCALTGRPFVRVNMTGDIESAVLFGQLVVEGGATVWKDGPVTEAVKYGTVVLLDEWDVTPPEILFGLQWLFEENGKLFIKEMPGTSADKFLMPHPNFRLVCAGNTVGQGDDAGRFAGTNVQNNASIDRFQTTVVLDYLEPAHEVKILEDNVPGIERTFAQQMVQFAALVRTACNQGSINLTMSPRTLINWGKKSVKFGDKKRALLLSFGNKLRDSDRKIVGEFHQKVFGSVL